MKYLYADSIFGKNQVVDDIGPRREAWAYVLEYFSFYIINTNSSGLMKYLHTGSISGWNQVVDEKSEIRKEILFLHQLYKIRHNLQKAVFGVQLHLK